MKRLIPFTVLSIVCTGWVRLPAAAQTPGVYRQLVPEQQSLVRRWIEEYQKISGAKLDPETAYDGLSHSARTTFQAITHALQRTRLTDKEGKNLGTALDLVELVESSSGMVPHARGDHQFRLYVFLKRDAIRRLDASREFRRTGDNTVFHIGYPVNFRLQGGAPSIQFSLTRTGRRADIDIDYRPSSGPMALFNGHLTAANSDIRAGNNYFRHVGRWEGLLDWWKNLFASRENPLSPKEVAQLEGTAETHKTPEQIEDAVHDFFQTWLVDKKPLEAVRYFSVKSYACLSEYADGSSFDKPLARAQILKHMVDTAKAAGTPKSLADILEPRTLYAPEAKPVPTSQKDFKLEHLRDDIAWAMDCRQKFHIALAERLAKPAANYNHFYGVMTRIKIPGRDPLIQLWSKEEGRWTIISWHFEHPFKAAAVPRVREKESAAPVRAPDPADPGVATASSDFLNTWLVKRNYRTAAGFFAPESLVCGAVLRLATNDHKGLERFLESTAKESGNGAALADHIRSVEHGHLHLQEASHSLSQAYVLAKASNELAGINSCQQKQKNGQISPQATQGDPHFDQGFYETLFSFRSAVGHPAVLQFLWAKRDGNFQIVSYDIIAR